MTTSVRVILCVSAITCAATGTRPGLSAQGPSPFENVAVGVHVYFPDGRVSSTWSTYKGDKLAPHHHEIYTTKSMCIFSNPGEAPADAGYGWRFDITPVREIKDPAGARLVARIDWSRAIERGQKASTPAGSAVVALIAGKPVALDFMRNDHATSGGCDAVGALLDISIFKKPS